MDRASLISFDDTNPDSDVTVLAPSVGELDGHYVITTALNYNVFYHKSTICQLNKRFSFGEFR